MVYYVKYAREDAISGIISNFSNIREHKLPVKRLMSAVCAGDRANLLGGKHGQYQVCCVW